MIIIVNNINIKKSEKMIFLLLEILIMNLIAVNFSWYLIFFDDIFLCLYLCCKFFYIFPSTFVIFFSGFSAIFLKIKNLFLRYI